MYSPSKAFYFSNSREPYYFGLPMPLDLLLYLFPPMIFIFPSNYEQSPKMHFNVFFGYSPEPLLSVLNRTTSYHTKPLSPAPHSLTLSSPVRSKDLELTPSLTVLPVFILSLFSISTVSSSYTSSMFSLRFHPSIFRSLWALSQFSDSNKTPVVEILTSACLSRRLDLGRNTADLHKQMLRNRLKKFEFVLLDRLVNLLRFSYAILL